MNIKKWRDQEEKSKLNYKYKKLMNTKGKLSEAISLPEIDDNETIFTRNKDMGRNIKL